MELRAAPRRLAAALAIAVVAGAASPACTPTGAAPRVERPAEAWFHPSARDTAPAPDDPRWRRVPLPDYWGLARRLRAHEGWYRLVFQARLDEPWAASIDGDWTALAVRLNGEPLIQAASQRTDLLPAEPGLVTLLPQSRLHAGANELLLRFETAPGRIGFLDRPAIGPTEAVRAHRAQRRLLHTTLPTSFAWFALACASIVGLLARWDESRAGAWFAAGTAAWCLPLVEPLRSLGGGLGGLPNAVLLHAFPPLFAVGFHRALRLRRPRVERLLLATIPAGAALRIAVPAILVPAVDWLWWIVDIGIAVYLVRLTVQTMRARIIPRAGALLFAGAFGIAAGAHDVASLVAGHPLLGFALSPYAPAVLGLTTAAALVSTLGHRLSRAQRLNLELEQRVDEKRRELAGSYARMAELERDRAVAAERTRLMREMHDGTGGQLVSALSMIEGGDFQRDAIAEVLRDALADLRSSIDSLDPTEPDLLTLLGAARARLEPRLEARGLCFAWEVRDIPAPAAFGPHTALQVLRIFQEAVVNALRHAQARVISVRTGEAQDEAGRWVFVEVADDGKGFAPAAAAAAERAGGGRGLDNMRRRAAAIGGALVVTSGPGGTTVQLRLPRADGAQSSMSTRPAASAS